MGTVELTTENFSDVVSGGGIVLIDFWATWCGPCRMFAPVFEQAAQQHTDIAFAKVDTEAQTELAQAFEIYSIPTLMVVRDGVVLHAQAGALPAAALEQLITQVRAVDMDAVRAEIAKQQEQQDDDRGLTGLSAPLQPPGLVSASLQRPPARVSPMWFADVALVLAAFAGGLWILAALGWVARPAALPAAVRGGLAVSGLPILLWAAQSQVVDQVADRSGVDPADLAVWSWFVDHRSPAATWVMRAVTTVGSPVGMTVLAAVVVVVLLLRRRFVEAGVVTAATAATSVLIGVFKNLYDRARPPAAQRLLAESNPSLPSGHALTSVVVVGVVVAVVLPALARTAHRVLLLAAGTGAVVAIGVSRLYLGVHWASDVLVGWLLGGAWLAVCVGVLVLARSRSAAAVPATREATAAA